MQSSSTDVEKNSTKDTGHSSSTDVEKNSAKSTVISGSTDVVHNNTKGTVQSGSSDVVKNSTKGSVQSGSTDVVKTITNYENGTYMSAIAENSNSNFISEKALEVKEDGEHVIGSPMHSESTQLSIAPVQVVDTLVPNKVSDFVHSPAIPESNINETSVGEQNVPTSIESRSMSALVDGSPSSNVEEEERKEIPEKIIENEKKIADNNDDINYEANENEFLNESSHGAYEWLFEDEEVDDPDIILSENNEIKEAMMNDYNADKSLDIEKEYVGKPSNRVPDAVKSISFSKGDKEKKETNADDEDELDYSDNFESSQIVHESPIVTASTQLPHGHNLEVTGASSEEKNVSGALLKNDNFTKNIDNHTVNILKPDDISVPAAKSNPSPAAMVKQPIDNKKSQTKDIIGSLFKVEGYDEALSHDSLDADSVFGVRMFGTEKEEGLLSDESNGSSADDIHEMFNKFNMLIKK